MNLKKNRWAPHVTVAAIVERDGRFLFVEEEINAQRFINQPAGHLEAGENLIEAVIRETLEETAWHFQPQFLSGIYRWIHPQSGATFLRHCFSGTVSDQTGQPLDKEILRTLWLTPDELSHQQIALRSPLVSQCVTDHLNGKQYPLALFQESNSGA
ncbi:MAG: NUDIX hydrolase [Gammaproteobacteria bacterium]|nr:NUDIX hydrolase [Gammaproteobacteria bacterium]